MFCDFKNAVMHIYMYEYICVLFLSAFAGLSVSLIFSTSDTALQDVCANHEKAAPNV